MPNWVSIDDAVQLLSEGLDALGIGHGVTARWVRRLGDRGILDIRNLAGERSPLYVSAESIQAYLDGWRERADNQQRQRQRRRKSKAT